tara:strand:- start:1131 stop:1268 length:138 start_codon:yes stop_codon:yes gene_type:complete
MRRWNIFDRQGRFLGTVEGEKLAEAILNSDLLDVRELPGEESDDG